MALSEIEREDLVNYRLDSAYETLDEVEVHIENKFFKTAANRLYYACFYAVTALLIKDGYETHTHNGVKILLGLHYVKENKIKKEHGDLFKHLFRLRQTGDYEVWIDVDQQDVAPLLEPAKNFIHEMERLINLKRQCQ